METDLAEKKPEDTFRFHQFMCDKYGAESLRKEGGQRHAQHTHAEDDYKGHIQYDIQETADNQVIQRVSGIPNRPQDAGAHIINEDEENARKVDAQIQNRISPVSYTHLDVYKRQTILMVTHDTYAASFASRILIFKDGCIIRELFKRGSRQEFYDSISAETAKLDTKRQGEKA